MVLLDEAPVVLIRGTTNNFHKSSDLKALARINDALSILQTSRADRLDRQKAELWALSRHLQSVEQNHTAVVASHDASGHAQEVLRLDTEKFRMAKGVSEVRSECERREGEMRGLGRIMEGLDNGDGKREDDAEEDETVLKLRIYRGLGVDVDGDGEGEFSRAVVRNRSKGNVRVVNIEDEVARDFYVGHIWGCL